MRSKITGIIIAGGKSSRMGVNKALLNLGKKTLIAHSIELLGSICDELLISANSSEYDDYNIPVIRDNYLGLGPIGGLEAALSQSKTEHNFVISCDTPFVSKSIFYSLAQNIQNEKAVVPLVNNRLEALVAYYSKSMLPLIREQIQQKNYKLQALLKTANAKFVNFNQPDIFRNINTNADLEKASSDLKIEHTNLILIAGDGRNVGKTTLACKIIKKLSAEHKVAGIKISPHFHKQDKKSEILIKNERFTIVKETLLNSKDSSLLLQAGAQQVFFIMCKQEHLQEAFSQLTSQLNNGPVVCESGGLHEIIKPGLFLL